MLETGTRLGPYEITALIGKGGMGEVYRARDPKLQRDVALKVLPARVATDPAQADRFHREATTLASLSHRNIAAVYGFIDGDHTPALVMELVEGLTLADRLARGAIPLDEALPIARQIAEALEAAHAQGIVHRDLKPANIKLRPEGEVKVLDFGLAKVLDTGSARSPQPDPWAPTVTLPALPAQLTAQGTIVGTGPYMSPEQARGGPVDRRTDLWAFGVVLWEMLTGKQLFAGATISDAIAAVLKKEPDWTMLPAEVPPSIRRLLLRCLRKDRNLRLDSAIAARLEIDEAMNAPQGEVLRSTLPPWLPWAAAGALLAGVLAVIGQALNDSSGVPAVRRVSAELGADVALRKDFGSAVIISPDGQTLVYATLPAGGQSLLHVRRLDQLAASPLRGTENAESPFFSPDGQWIGFFAGKKLQKIAVNGGTAVPICDAPGARGGSWAEDGSIVFSASVTGPQVLMRVPADGGSPAPLRSAGDEETYHRWPQVLPGNRDVLYTSSSRSDNWDDATIMVMSPGSGGPKAVVPGTYGRYVESGHLLYVKGGTLYAAPFDPRQGRLIGASAAVAENVVADASTGGAQFAASTSGTLVLLQGPGYSQASPSLWMDRGGNTTSLYAEPVNWGNPQISSDGKYLALDISDGRQIDIWVHQLGAENPSRRTFDGKDDYKPVWSPDGDRLVYTSKRDTPGNPNDPGNLYWQRADGSGTAERLTRSPNEQRASSWHPGGRYLAFHEATGGNGNDVMILPFERDGESRWKPGKPVLFAGGPLNQSEAVFSPDGRWLAYTSHEKGGPEIVVRAFDRSEGRWQVSSGGGRDAAWSRTRSELLYLGIGQRRIMAAPYAMDGITFRPGSARPWSATAVGVPERIGRKFALHPDGERVLIAPPETQKQDHVTLVFGFFEQLRQATAAAQ